MSEPTPRPAARERVRRRRRRAASLLVVIAGAIAVVAWWLASRTTTPPVYAVVVPPGFTMAQIAARVGAVPGHSARAFLRLAESGEVRSAYEPAGVTRLEGLLFPATYRVTAHESDRQILEAMVARFDLAAREVGLSSAPSTVHVSPYQAVTVASLVEREALLAGDRGKVATVVYNRLAQGMKLQVDATIIYALGRPVSSVSAKDKEIDSPYNTYKVAGLPPTPIASPGVASLEAALHPTPGPWLYYVVVSHNGAEAFSATYAGQLQNIALGERRGVLP
ncbi:MAG: endolytic transglycosylase MltG [Acidimicrobiales bacterium]|nr:endolytic transglycosylase MltG [Acidimicrobiales bacterium]